MYLSALPALFMTTAALTEAAIGGQSLWPERGTPSTHRRASRPTPCCCSPTGLSLATLRMDSLK